MAYTYEDVIPSLIPNTVMKKRILNGVHRTYIIVAIDGYVLHDKAGDYVDVNLDTYEETPRMAFFRWNCTCAANYDFTPVQVTDENGVTYTAYGAREFFAIPESDVPSNQIFGGVDNNDREIM